MKATRAYIEALTTAIAKDEKISFKEGKGWSTDIKNRVLHYPPNDLLKHDIDAVKGFIIHETGHINFTTIVDNKIQKEHPSIQQVYNVLEDLRIENEQIKKYSDFASEPLKTINSMGLLSKIDENGSKALQQAPKLVQYLHELQSYLIPEALNLHYTLGGTILYKIQDTMRLIIDENVHNRVMDTLNNIGTSTLTDTILNCNNTGEIADIAEIYILPYIKDLLDEADEQQRQAQQGNREAQEQMKKQGTEPTKEYGTGYQAPKLYRNESLPTNNELNSLLNPYINTLSHRLMDILKEKAQTRYNGNYKQGKLLSKNAYKVLTGDHRIFSKRNNPDKPNYTVTMILDESGSMKEGAKHPNTFMASYMLDKVCKKMGFKVNLIKMDTNPTVINTIDEYRKIKSGGNSEIKALEQVKITLNKFDDNIVFLLTDGLACDNYEEIKTLLRQLQTEYNTTLLTIGIALPSRDIETMRLIYPNSIQAENPENLPTILINTMKRLITR